MGSKDRLTVMMLAAADGAKAPALVIGKQANPRILKGAQLPPDVVYISQARYPSIGSEAEKQVAVDIRHGR